MNININLAEFGGVILALLSVGALLKHAFPNFPNRLIPLFTWVLGVVAYLAISKGWADAGQWIAAVVAAATATGAHSGVKNTMPEKGENIAPPLSLWLLVGVLSLSGCASLFDTVVTIKDVGDAVSREYAQLYKQGLITPEQDAKAEAAHAAYREAMAGLAITLEAAKASGDNSTVPAKLRAAKQAIDPLLDLITPLLTKQRANTLEQQLTKASAQ